METKNTHIFDVLRCPSCFSALDFGKGKWTCVRCQRSGTIDEHGIIHLTDEEYYYREVDQQFFKWMEEIEPDGDVKKYFEKALRSLDERKRDFVGAYALDPHRAGAVALAAVHEGTLSLDFGSGWGNFTRVISHLGGKVFSVDMTYESLLFSKMVSCNEKETFIKAGRQYPLPFADQSFDFIFLNGVLEWIPEDYMKGENPKVVQRRFLQEFHRLLKAGGRMIIGIENRNSFMYWSGCREDHTGLRFGACLPRKIASLYSLAVRNKPYRTYTYTRRGYKTLLKESGFANIRFYIPWFRYRSWMHLFREEAINSYPLIKIRKENSLFRKMAKHLLKTMQRAHFLNLFSPDFYITADKEEPGTPSRDTLVGFLTGVESDREEEINMINAATSHCLSFKTSSKFYKVPLSKDANSRLEAEVKAMTRLRQTRIKRFLLPWCHLRDVRGIKYLVFPAVPLSKNLELGNHINYQLNEIDSFLKEISCDSTMAKIGETQLWNRIRSDSMKKLVIKLTGTELLWEIIRRLEDRRVPAGMVHGDFWYKNVFITGNFHLYIVDWDRFEDFSPKFLDLVHFYVHYVKEAEDKPIDQILRELTGPKKAETFAERIWSTAGELSPEELATLYLLDRLWKDFWDFSKSGYLSSKWYKEYRGALKICQTWFH